MLNLDWEGNYAKEFHSHYDDILSNESIDESINWNVNFIKKHVVAEVDSWLIWSNEHSAWWEAGSDGYTNILSQAGRYKFIDALAIVKQANYDSDGSGYCVDMPAKPYEVMCPSPEMINYLLNNKIPAK